MSASRKWHIARLFLATAEAEHKYIKQTGGKGQYGHVRLTLKPMEPLAEGEKIPKNVNRYDDFEFINSIKGGVIPQRIHSGR